jgi:peptidoglycan/xylan/chitin deacetylase (PgdA/CDA1 family)/glycosyltransferase involved in cell wall biosynthesis
MGNNPQISVVMATWNRRKILLRSLQTVFAQDIEPERYEVIVVVDGSTDGTAEALREFRPSCTLRVLERCHRGISAARNDGIRAAQGEIILILDDDILCEPNLLRQHLDAHANAPPQVVFGPFPVSLESSKTLASDCLRQVGQDWMESFARDPRLVWPRDAAIEPNTSIHRTVLQECGAFDESIPYQREDSEIGMRFWKRGVPYRFLPAAVAHHEVVKKTWDMMSRDAPLFGKNDLLLARKVPEYRPFSVPSRMAEGPRSVRALRRIVATLPFSPAIPFYALLWPFEKLRRFEFFRRWGTKLLNYEMSAMSIRSAAREAGSWSDLRREFGMRLPVLMYHRIGEIPHGCVLGLSIPPNVFEHHIRWLARHGYKTIRVADWLAWIREGKSLPPKPLLLTFDDAYADTAQYGLPVLQRYGFSGVVFVVTGVIGQTNKWDEAAGNPSLRMMTAEQIRHWARQGIEFGAHTRTHPDLTIVSSQKLEEEIAGSSADLGELLQTRITSFAYPYGFFNEAAKQVASRVFDLSFTIEQGINTLAADPHAQRRVMVLPDDPLVKLGWRARFGFDPVERLRERFLLLRMHIRRVFIKVFFGSTEEISPPRT